MINRFGIEVADFAPDDPVPMTTTPEARPITGVEDLISLLSTQLNLPIDLAKKLIAVEVVEKLIQSDLQLESIPMINDVVLSIAPRTIFPADLRHVGLGYAGGAAREWLLKTITGSKQFPRDIDVVKLPEVEDLDYQGLSDLAEKYMEHDFKHGHGIKTIRLDDYFFTRDLTINEVLALQTESGPRLYFTINALVDILAGTVRPTVDYVGKVKAYTPKSLLKSIRLATELKSFHGNDKAFVPDVEEKVLESVMSDPEFHFFMTLNLQKAAERGINFLIKYYCSLEEYGLISRDFLNSYRPRTNKYLSIGIDEVLAYLEYLDKVFGEKRFIYSEDNELNDWIHGNTSIQKEMKFHDIAEPFIAQLRQRKGKLKGKAA